MGSAPSPVRDWDAIPPHVPHAKRDRPTIRQRFEKFIHHEPNTGCWIWGGSIGGHTYGQFMLDGLPHLAHRLSYEMNVGPIPAGLHLDHLCRNRECVCPSHLEPVTTQENSRRGWKNGNPKETHWGCGHAKAGNVCGRAHPRCRICNLAWQKAHRNRGARGRAAAVRAIGESVSRLEALIGSDAEELASLRATVSRLEKREGRP